ncbi:MAG: DUF2130 domain-containing protein [Dehalococcoidia bacterium]
MSSLTLLAGTSNQAQSERCPWCDNPITHRQFEEIRARIASEERKRAADAAAQLEAELNRERAEAKKVVESERARLAKEADARVTAEVKSAREEAAEASRLQLAEMEKAAIAAEARVDALEAGQEDMIAARLKEQRTALEKDKIDALNAERAQRSKDELKFKEKVDLLQRQLEKKTAEDLGEGAEVDLFETLREAFPEDLITRVGKGKEGADILHRVRDSGGHQCGSIVYDSKNRTAWRNEYVTKLRKDQLVAKAEHAILTSLAFPAGARQLHLQDSVVVCNPARARAIVELLRRHIVQTHTMRLSAEARAEKTAHLYDFVTSDQCAQLLEQIEARAADILTLDVTDKKAHESTWKKRGEMVRAIERAHLDLSTEIDRIIGGQSIRLVK